jgi:glycosyltransferase involved in cell wall biosynthesis
MKNPKISVIMPVYDELLEWISESIDSILQQTFSDFEFIIINDNPKRKKLQTFLEKYKIKDKRITLIANKKNSGSTKSRNKGLKIASGEYIAIMDCGDISFKERLNEQYVFLEKYKNCFLNYFGVNFVDKNKKRIARSYPIIGREKLYRRLLHKNCIAQPTIMFRNIKILYREKFLYSQDYDLYLNILSMSLEISSLNKILMDCRVRENSISSSKMPHQKLFAEKAKEFYFQRLAGGKDKYSKFDIREIMQIDVEKSNNKLILESNMKANFGLNDYKRFRQFYKRYVKHYGFSNKFLIIYLLTFLGKRMINFLMNMTPSFILRKMNN